MDLPRRPRLRLHAPEIMHPEEDVPVVVRLAARRAVKVGAVTVALLEKRRLRVEANAFALVAGVAPRSEQEVGHVVLRERISLRPGTTDLAGTLQIGAAWPSVRGDLIHVTHRLRVHAEVAWWPDAERLFPVHVRMAPREGQAPPTGGTEMQGEQGRLRVAVERTTIRPGEKLAGWWRAKRHRDLGGISLQLVRVERAGAQVSERTYQLMPEPVRTKGGRKGFQVPMPDDLEPTLDAGAWRLDWFLEASAEGAPDWLVRIPLVVQTRRDEGGAAVWHGGVLDAPMRQAWRRVARRFDLALDPADTLAGKRGLVSVTLQAEERGRRAELATEIHWPSLAMALWAAPGSLRGGGVAPPVSPEITLSDAPRFTRGGRLRAREEAQAAALLAGPPALALEALALAGTLGLDDAGALSVRRWSGAVQEVESLAEDALRLAAAMDAALADAPPPRAFDVVGALKRWAQLAVRLHGTLRRGDFRIEGKTPAGPVEIETCLAPGGTAQHTIVRLRPEPPIAHRWLAGGADPLDANNNTRARRARKDHRTWPLQASQALRWLEERHGALTLTPGEVALRLPAPLVDPAPAEAALEAMVRMCRALLGGDAGPYR